MNIQTLKRGWHSLRLMMIFSSGDRADYLKRHHIFYHVGDNCTIVERKIPLYPRLISIGNNVHLAAKVLLVPHDAIHLCLNNYANLQGPDYIREKIGCIVFSNFEDAPLLVTKIRKALLDEYLKQEGFSKKQIHKRKTVKTDITRYIKKYDTVLGPVSFCLNDAGDLQVKIDSFLIPVRTLEGGWVECILPKPLKALPEEIRTLHHAYLKQAVYFGHEVLMLEYNGVKKVIGCQYTEPAINDKWLKAIGSYQPYDIAHEGYQGMDLHLENGELVLVLKIIGENLKYYLHVLNEGEAIVKGFGRNCLQTVTLKTDEGKSVLKCDAVTGIKSN